MREGEGSLSRLYTVSTPQPFCESFSPVAWLVDQWENTKNPFMPANTLVFCENSAARQHLQNALREAWPHAVSSFEVVTLNGFVRETLLTLWPLAERVIQRHFPEFTEWAQLTPELVGLEESERLFQMLLNQHRAQHNGEYPFAHTLNEGALLRQLVRRVRLRAEQRLTRTEMAMADKSLPLAQEFPADFAALHQIERHFEALSLKLRHLDFTRQLDVLLGLLDAPETQRLPAMPRPKLILWLNADESPPAQRAVLDALLPHAEALLVQLDPQGGARRGYLNADTVGTLNYIETLKKNAHQHTELISPEERANHWAETLFHSLLGKPAETPNPPPEAPRVHIHASQRSTLEMLDAVVRDVQRFLQSKSLSLSDIAIVTPQNEPLVLAPLQIALQARGLKFQVLSGTQRPASSWPGRLYILLMQALHGHQLHMPLSRFEWRMLMVNCLGLQQSEAKTLDAFCEFLASTTQQRQTAGLPLHRAMPTRAEIPEGLIHAEASFLRYESFITWAAAMENVGLEDVGIALSHRWIYPHFRDEDDDTPLQQLHRSLLRHAQMMTRLGVPPADLLREWLWQSKFGSTADTPVAPQALEPDALILGSPQKLIDFRVRRPVMLWLDTYNPNWMRTDEAPLYNSVLHSPAGIANLNAAKNKGETAYTPESLALATEAARRERAAHLLRKLAYLSTAEIHCFSAELDIEGRDQTQTPDTLQHAITETLRPLQTGQNLAAIPLRPLREDQAAVLNYRTGLMAISAVPGAGKTFVTVELILNLIKTGIPPEEILVLTYMESAARTLQSRLKPILNEAGLYTLPQISTIHALAFRMLNERDHAARLGFERQNFRMADEPEQLAFCMEAARLTHPLATNREDISPTRWQAVLQQAIQYSKSIGLNWQALAAQAETLKNDRLDAMAEGMRHYERLLRERHALDYTDLIVRAIQLLEEHPDIRARYQAQFRLIIEDEAQDSSSLLQRLLQLLGGEAPNLVRCGDTNQSITTTFSAAEPEVFRHFIQSAKTRVLMEHSGRCAEAVMQMANGWLKAASEHPELAGAFLPATMRGITGINPTLAEPIQTQVFANEIEEREAILNALERIRRTHPQASCAILLRHNKDVMAYADALQAAGHPVFAHLDKQPDTRIFRLLAAWLNVLVNPHETQARLNLFETLADTLPDILHLSSDEGEDLESARQELRDMMASIPLFALPPEEVETLPRFFQESYATWHDMNALFASVDIPSALITLSQRLLPDALVDRCNGTLASLQAQRILQRYGLGLEVSEQQQLNLFEALQHLSPLELVWRHLESITRSRRGVPVFTEELLNPTQGEASSDLQPPVQVMSLHKAKGMEFDFVWMPMMTQAKFPDAVAQIKIRESDKALIGLKRVAQQHFQPDIPLAPLNEAILAYQQNQIQEEARLLYVGFTRAKRGLFLSAHEAYKNPFHRVEKTQPTLAFRYAQNALTPASSEASP